jgi:hypothetical protein
MLATTKKNGRVIGLDDGSESTLGQGGHYIGDWDDELGVPSGAGRMDWDNGVSYEGQWAKGKLHGEGSKLYSRGGGYVGNWVENQRQGEGVCLFAGKFGYEKWTGTFLADQPHGNGKMLYQDGVEGEFEFDMGTPLSTPALGFEGPLSNLDDGSPSTLGIAGYYKGGWCADSTAPDGFGIMQWENGIEYKGMWKKGLYHGHGRKLYSRGGGYEGAWVNGQREGLGISFYGAELVQKHGILRWEGPFENDQAHGVGQAYISSALEDKDERWIGDLAIKGPVIEFRNGQIIK